MGRTQEQSRNSNYDPTPSRRRGLRSSPLEEPIAYLPLTYATGRLACVIVRLRNFFHWPRGHSSERKKECTRITSRRQSASAPSAGHGARPGWRARAVLVDARVFHLSFLSSRRSNRRQGGCMKSHGSLSFRRLEERRSFPCRLEGIHVAKKRRKAARFRNAERKSEITCGWLADRSPRPQGTAGLRRLPLCLSAGPTEARPAVSSRRNASSPSCCRRPDLKRFFRNHVIQGVWRPAA